MSEYITKKDKSDSNEFKSKYITKKKKKIDLGKIVSEAMNKNETPKYITKKQKFITKKTPEQIREREMVKKAKGGRAGLRGGGICKRGMNRQAIGKNS